jgi:hypothetical protein
MLSAFIRADCKLLPAGTAANTAAPQAAITASPATAKTARRTKHNIVNSGPLSRASSCFCNLTKSAYLIQRIPMEFP